MIKVVFCSSEVVPFAKTGGMADVCGALPLALEKYGIEVSIFLPRYRGIESAGVAIQRRNDGMSTATIGRNIQVYFVEHDDFFKRDGIYGDQKGGYNDNLERFQFFCSRVLQEIEKWKERPDIIHCHDWQTALIPVYLKLFHGKSKLQKVKTIFTLHNMAYQGVFPKEKLNKLGLDHQQFNQAGLEYFNQINLLKAGIVNADVVTTVSPQYAEEIQTKTYGCGLDGVLRSRRDKVIGILNGVDCDYWDPGHDPLIHAAYSLENLDNKAKNKAALQEICGFPENENVPVFGFVGRLAQQKGLDLLAGAMDALSRADLQIAVVGIGEQKYQDMLRHLSNCYSSKLRLFLKFDEQMAHQVYAGSDFFLMPSQYEPCGLSQLISLRYAAIPVVYKTGGLADTIKSYLSGGNGFVFEQYTRESFVGAIFDALRVYPDRLFFKELMSKAMTCDFSWSKSAQKYVGIYEQVAERLGGTQ